MSSKSAAKPLHTFEDEDIECPEIVGSSDLRDVFRERGRIRGSFSINGFMFHQFEASSIDNLLAQINAHQSEAHVDASIDDGYHLVLEARSPAPIIIALGPAFEEPPPPQSDVPGQVVHRLKSEADDHNRRHGRENERPRNSILEDLGLEETARDEDDPRTAPQPAAGIPSPGMTAEERHKRRVELGRAKSKDGDLRPQTDTSVTSGWDQRAGEALTPNQRAAESVGESGRAASGRENLGINPTEEQKITGSSQGTGLQHPS